MAKDNLYVVFYNKRLLVCACAAYTLQKRTKRLLMTRQNDSQEQWHLSIIFCIKSCFAPRQVHVIL